MQPPLPSHEQWVEEEKIWWAQQCIRLTRNVFSEDRLYEILLGWIRYEPSGSPGAKEELKALFHVLMLEPFQLTLTQSCFYLFSRQRHAELGIPREHLRPEHQEILCLIEGDRNIREHLFGFVRFLSGPMRNRLPVELSGFLFDGTLERGLDRRPMLTGLINLLVRACASVPPSMEVSDSLGPLHKRDPHQCAWTIYSRCIWLVRCALVETCDDVHEAWRCLRYEQHTDLKRMGCSNKDLRAQFKAMHKHARTLADWLIDPAYLRLMTDDRFPP